MNSLGLIIPGAFLADLNGKNLFLHDGYQISSAGVKWLPVVVQLYNAFNFTLGATLQHCNLNVNAAEGPILRRQGSP